MLQPRTSRKICLMHLASHCFLLVALVETKVDAANPVTVEDVQKWSTYLRDDFDKIRTELLHTDGFKPSASEYKTTTYSVKNAEADLEEIVKKLLNIIKAKEKIVERLRKETEKMYNNYNTPSNVTCETFQYHRAKNLLEKEVKFNPNQEMCKQGTFIPIKASPLLYNISVNWVNSTSHVPTNVYDGSKSILMVAEWTRPLDKQFSETHDGKHGEVEKWQYFGSSKGLFRIYPGVRWKIQIGEIGEGKPVDFFDCRSQPWYIEAAAFPKNIVILVDKSGSMKGRRETIANLTVSEILDTLTENDFFNVILFNNSIHYGDPTSEGVLLQATLKNKRRIMSAMNIEPSGIADYKKGLTAAFDLLNQSKPDSDKPYNQAIMIISDGAPDYFPALFNQRNPNKTVRVFTYMIGQEASDRENVQKMACNNRGFFVQIATLADVKENVQTYLPVMARTNARRGDRFTVWTGVHSEQIKADKHVNFETPPPNSNTSTTPTAPTTTTSTTVSSTTSSTSTEASANASEPVVKPTKKEPIVLFTSIAQAVYNKKNETDLLLGVVGLDVPISTFEKHAPPWKYGVHGFSFASNNNGYVLYHPNFRPFYKNNLKPFYQNVDIAEVEMPVDMKPINGNPDYNLTLRTEMINRETGNTMLEVYNIPDAFKSAYKKTMKYFYKPLKGTPFTIGLALHWDKSEDKSYPILEVAKVSSSSDPNFLKSLFQRIEPCVVNNKSAYGLKIIPYTFCRFDHDMAVTFNHDPVCALIDVLENTTKWNSEKCEMDFIKNVYRDAEKSKQLMSKWKNAWKKNSSIGLFGIDQVFMLFYSGLILFYNESTPSQPEFINEHLRGAKDSLFETTLDSAELYDEHQHLYFEPPPAKEGRTQLDKGNFSLTATSIIYAQSPKPKVPVAVTGVQISYKKLKEHFLSKTMTTEGGCNSTGVDCYLVSSNGYVILSARRNEDLAQPLAEVDCWTMERLVNKSIFQQITIYDFQAICVYPLSSSSFANRLIDPITKLIGTISWLTYHLTIFLVEFFTTSLWTMITYAQEFLTLDVPTVHNEMYSNQSYAGIHRDDPALIRQTEATVKRCRNQSDEEGVIKCFQEFLNGLCRRTDGQSGNDCITACKALRKFSPDHWNAHEKCVYPTKPCSKEHTVYRVTKLLWVTKEGSVDCGRCRKQWIASAIDKTNLLMVVVWPSRATCSCPCSPNYRTSTEMKVNYTSSVPNPAERKPPEWLNNIAPVGSAAEENDRTAVCSNGTNRRLTPFNLMIAIVILFGLFGLRLDR